MSDSGTINSVKLFGIFFPASGETDLNRKSGQFTTESQPTTGQNNMKLTKQSEDIESVDLVLSGAKRELLIEKIDERRDGDLEVQLISGDAYTASGRVTITGDTSMDAKITVSLLPRGRWTGVIV